MSDTPQHQPEQPADPGSAEVGLPAAEIEAPRRAASLTLRGEQSEGGAGALMHSANQSLAEALRLTFRVLVFAMGVLVVIYLLSGMQSIKENEKGIATLFGEIRGEMDPGLRFTAPAPFGDVVRVVTGTETSFSRQDPEDPGRVLTGENLLREFMPAVNRGEESKPFRDFASSGELDPRRDDSLITADQNLVHGRWRMSFERQNPTAWVQTITPTQEGELLRSVVRWAIVREVAATNLEEYLKPQLGSAELPGRVQARANRRLEQLGTGLRITELRLEDRLPPRNLLEQFERVQSAAAEAQRSTTEAESYRSSELTRLAGPAYQTLIDLIDEYERLYEADDPAADDTLAQVHAFLEGRAVAGAGEGLRTGAAGEVSRIISEARTRAQSTEKTAEADYARFAAALDGYLANPELMVMRLWSTMYEDISQHPLFEVVAVPADTRFVMSLNRDSESVQRRIEQRNFEQAQRAEEDRMRASDRAAAELRAGRGER